MSAICGIYHKDDQPVSIENLQKQMTALAHCGPDGSGVWHSGNIGLGHQMMHITPESVTEELPASSKETPNLTITADARLDNREELFTRLGISSKSGTTITDSQLLLAAYQKWGADCPRYLLGDFAFAIWDKTNRTLFCARDHMGIRPFYYYFEQSLFVFASDVIGVIAHPQVPRELNDLAFAWYLQDMPINANSMTFYVGVKPLPPAHTLTINSQGLRLTSYWSPADCPPIHLSSLDDYAEMLRDLLQKSVACRLRSAFPIGAHLSGGLDSSTIAVLAARMLRERNQSLPTFSWIPDPQPGDDLSDPEWAYSRMICEQEDLTIENVNLTAEKVAAYLWRDISQYDNVGIFYEFLVREAAKQKGVRVMLSGWGGDELISFQGQGYYSELFCGLHWKKLFHTIRMRLKYPDLKQSFSWQFRYWLGIFYRKVFLPILPDRIYALIDRKWVATPNIKCVAPAFLAFIRQNRPPFCFAFRERIGLHSEQMALLKDGHLTARIEAWAKNGALDQMAYAYPLMDKRIVDFSLGIPSDLYVRNGFGRFLFRSSIGGIIPDEIRWNRVMDEPRRFKQYEEIMQKAVRIWFAQALQRNVLGFAGRYIDTGALMNSIPKKKGQLEMTTHTFMLSQSLQVLLADFYSENASGKEYDNFS